MTPYMATAQAAMPAADRVIDRRYCAISASRVRAFPDDRSGFFAVVRRGRTVERKRPVEGR